MATREALLQAIPASPAGAQARWYLSMLLAGGEGFVAADLDRYTPQQRAQLDPAEDERGNWASFAARMGEVLAVALETASDHKLSVLVSAQKDRKWRFTLEVEPEAPHRISAVNWERVFDFKLETREATPADIPILLDIEARVPIELGDTSIYFDRSRDYFAFARLMDDVSIGLASADGVPAAVSCGARHIVRIGGTLHPIVTVLHLRVLPEHQRKGLWGAANKILDRFWPSVDGSNAYISVDNAGMQHGFVNNPNKWPQLALRAQLPCAELSGPPAGRPATAADAPALAARLNAFHDDHEMFAPYTAESLAARVERAPDQYGWDRVWLTDGAMVGVWPSGVGVITETAGVRTRSVRGLVLDYAFDAGAEDEFEALLRAWCAALQTQGMDTLSIFTSPNTPGVDLLRSLARAVEPFNMWTPGLAVPAGAAERGLYVDPIYF